MVEGLQRQLLGAQRQPAGGVEAGVVLHRFRAARPLALELEQYVSVESRRRFVDVEGVGEELPHAGPERAVVLGGGGLASDEQDRRAGADERVVAQRAARLERIGVEQRVIQRDDVRPRGAGALERLRGGEAAQHGVAVVFAELFECEPRLGMMARDEEAGRVGLVGRGVGHRGIVRVIGMSRE